MADRKIYVSKVSGLADYDGRQVPLVAGVTRVREGHPLLKGRESVFEEITVQYDIEDARSAPQDEPKPEPVAAAPAEAEVKAPAVDDEDYLAAPAKKPAPRRGPRKSTGAGS